MFEQLTSKSVFELGTWQIKQFSQRVNLSPHHGAQAKVVHKALPGAQTPSAANAFHYVLQETGKHLIQDKLIHQTAFLKLWK